MTKKPRPFVHPELRNMAEDFEQDKLKEIADIVVSDYKKDEDSRREWMQKHAQWVRLYFQAEKPINPPWEGSSDESMPMLTEACNQFSARAFKAMFPNRNFIKAVPIGKSDSKAKERAERVSTHMSWQCLVKDRSYKRNKDRMLTALPLHGSMFTKTYYCPVRKRNVTDNVRAVDLVVPYGTGPREIADLDRMTHIIRMPVTRTQILAGAGYLLKAAEAYAGGEKSDVDSEAEKIEGMTEPLEAGNAVLLEQHRLLDLDDDGIPEPYIVTVDYQSGDVLRLCIGYETDEIGGPKNGVKERVEYFTHYVFLENPDGFYGLGQGHMIAPLNTAVNKMLRQAVDAGTLANAGNHSGFISNTLGLPKGDVGIKIGKFTPVGASVDDLNKGVYTFKFPGPSAASLQIMQAIMARADRLGTTTEAVTGQSEKVMQPTTVLALIEQAMEVFSAIYERVLDSWERELGLLYNLNRKHLDPEEYYTVLDVMGAMKETVAGRDDYADDMQIKPIADPKMASDRQKLARAEAEYQFALQNPLVMQSPVHVYNASKRFLVAIGAEDIGEILPNPQRGQERVDDPMQENAMALMREPFIAEAFPDQDHMMHLQAHQGFLDDPEYGPILSDLGRNLVTEHIKAHIAFMYGATESANGAGPGLGMGPLGQDAGNGSPTQGATGNIPAELAGMFNPGSTGPA